MEWHSDWRMSKVGKGREREVAFGSSKACIENMLHHVEDFSQVIWLFCLIYPSKTENSGTISRIVKKGLQ